MKGYAATQLRVVEAEEIFSVMQIDTRETGEDSCPPNTITSGAKIPCTVREKAPLLLPFGLCLFPS